MQRRPDGTKLSRHVWPRLSRPVRLGRQAQKKRSLDRRSRDVRVATRRTKEKFVNLLIPSEKNKNLHCFVWYARVRQPFGRQRERACRRMTGHWPTAGHGLVAADTSDYQAALCSCWTLAQAHLQAEHRNRLGGSTSFKGQVEHMRATAQELNDAVKYDPYFDFCFFFDAPRMNAAGNDHLSQRALAGGWQRLRLRDSSSPGAGSAWSPPACGVDVVS